MALFTESFLREKARGKFGYLTEASLRTFSADALGKEKRAASLTQTYDIFLSHSSEDAILIKALRDELAEQGYSVYVDWIDDPQLDRAHVNRETAAVLRERMRSCRSLLFATSAAARGSIWMPWELGYVDARTGARVAIVPIVPDPQASAEFKGQEYLGLYPYLDKSGTSLWIHASANSWISFTSWISGVNPAGM
jgi:hypothetical protein